MPKLLNEYVVSIYEDGSSTIKPYKKTKVINDLTKCSARIRQSILIIKYSNMSKEKEITDKIAEGIKKTAEVENVTMSSCVDKISRQLNLTVSEFRKLYELYNKQGDEQLINKLKDYIGKNTENEDIEAINCFLS